MNICEIKPGGSRRIPAVASNEGMTINSLLSRMSVTASNTPKADKRFTGSARAPILVILQRLDFAQANAPKEAVL